MAPRRRKIQSVDGVRLAPNLYASQPGKKSLRYRHPQTGKFHGMGSDVHAANKAARRLNQLLTPSDDLVDKVMGAGAPMAEVIELFKAESLPDRDLAEETVKLYELRLKQIGNALKKPADEVTTLNIRDFLNTFADRTRSRNQLRTILIDLFNFACAEGICSENPAAVTRARKERRERHRHTVEGFWAIHEHADHWLQIAMELALITLQRREDIVNLKRSDERDGRLYVIQRKTKKHDTGYLSIEITPALRDVLNRSIDNVPSPYIVHRKPQRLTATQRAAKDHWTCIEPDFLSKKFDEARTKAGAYAGMSVSERPGFHQIRALGIKLYKDAGIDPQGLAGHGSSVMTKNYDAGHDEIRWVYVTASLELPPKP